MTPIQAQDFNFCKNEQFFVSNETLLFSIHKLSRDTDKIVQNMIADAIVNISCCG